MDFEYFDSLFKVGQIDLYGPIEPPRSKQSRIQRLLQIGCCHDDDLVFCVKAIHIHKQLVQGVFLLFVGKGT